MHRMLPPPSPPQLFPLRVQEMAPRKQLRWPISGAKKQLGESSKSKQKMIITTTSLKVCNQTLAQRECNSAPRPSASDSIKTSKLIASPLTLCIVIIIASYLCFLHLSCLALKVSVSIPELVKLNDSFWLECSPNGLVRGPLATGNQQQQHQANSQQNGPHGRNQSANAFQQIYSIKWYKDGEEFYSFLPNGDPRVSYYETKGVQPDRAKSHEGNVLVTKADLNSEGNYRCEILSEGPVFETVRKSKHLKVFALPVRGPRIEILDSNGKAKSLKTLEISYDVGDMIDLRCNSAPSKPPVRLRWWINDREIPVQGERPTDRNWKSHSSPLIATHGFNVSVTQTEHRVAYKSIQSSHSTLSMALSREQIINGRISFKCLASIRQEVLVSSKQLILLAAQQQQQPQSQPQPQPPPSAGSSSAMNGFADDGGRGLRSARASQELAGPAIEPELSGGASGMVRMRHRAQYNMRPSAQQRHQAAQPQAGASNQVVSRRMSAIMHDGELISSLEDTSNQMMYVYEDADSTLGPSIVDSPETLRAYLGSQQSNESTANNSNSLQQHSSQAEYNHGDNLEYIQQIRLRQKSNGPSASSAASATGGQTTGPNLRRANYFPIKSPFYLDEHDTLRPIINWPPLESGKLLLLPPGNSLVAIPTQSGATNRASEIKFVMPPVTNSEVPYGKYSSNTDDPNQIILERLAESLNCTCSEPNLDTKLNWVVNDKDLIELDVRRYPTRISPDHRQTWMIIGLQAAANLRSVNSLASFLAKHQKSIDARGLYSQAAALRTRQQVPVGNEQLRFMCQAQHSFLLYSSSETIRLDFNQPLNELDSNGLTQSSSNVIQAAEASPTRSRSSTSQRSQSIFTTRSQLVILVISMISSICIMAATLPTRTLSIQHNHHHHYQPR